MSFATKGQTDTFSLLQLPSYTDSHKSKDFLQNQAQMNTRIAWADLEGEGWIGGQDPPENSQKLKVS